MSRSVTYLATLILGMLFSTSAGATCPTFHTLSNGSTANADDVMDNFNYTLNCPVFGGFVGIGTPTPARWLNVRSDTFPISRFEHPQSTNDTGGTMEFFGGTSGSVARGYLGFGHSGTASATIFTGELADSFSVRAEGALHLGAGGNQLIMTASTAGVIGIGTTAPDSNRKLTISGASNSASILFNDTTDSSGFYLGVFNAYGSGNFSIDENGVGSRLAIAKSTGNVGIGTTTPAQKLEVNGQIKVDSLASASGTALCINASVLASCSSSRRYKENIRDAGFGLKEIEAMRPVTFKWKGRDENDFGFVAEEIAKIDSRYVTYKAGRIEGVKYPQLTAVLVNAVKQLKVANDNQVSEIAHLRALNAAVVGQLKQQAADVQIMRTRFDALERKLSVRTAENQVAIRH